MADGKQLMVFPFTVPTDGAGQMRDPAQGVYARSLARTLAERLSVAPSMNAVAATLTSGGPLNEVRPAPPLPDSATGWVVASQPWTLDEAVKVGLPDGTEYLLHGVAELTDRIRLRLMLVDQSRAAMALDHVVLRPRNELFSALDEAASAVATAARAGLAGGAVAHLRRSRRTWPTCAGRDMSAAHEAGVQVADASKSFDGYLEALRRDPAFQEAQDRVLALALDFALGGQGPVEAARAGCERLLKIDSNAFKAHAALAEIDLSRGEVPAAIAHLRAALAQRPDWVPVFERLGTALLRQGDYQEALKWLERAVAERPDDADALQSLGVALAETGDLEGAVARFGQAIEKGGHSVALHENMGRALTALGRHREAREQRALARKLSGRAPFGLNWLRSRSAAPWAWSERAEMAEQEALIPEPEPIKTAAPLPGTLGSMRPPALNLILFGLTCASAFVAGATLTDSALPTLTQPEMIRHGLAFAAALLAILLSHEMGHFLLARRHGVDATWPFFIPAPLLSLIGTLGAVMKLRSLPRTRRALIDIAVAGPLAGFAVTLPVLALGIWLSPIVIDEPAAHHWSLARAVETLVTQGHWLALKDGFDLGEPLAMRAIGWLVHGTLPAGKALALHPVAIAGWFGLLLTALNLLPLGQLDGGHLLYGISPKLHRAFGPPISGVLVGLGVFSPFVGWLLWGLLTGLWFNQHPPLSDSEGEKLDPLRRALLILAAIVMVLSFVAAPLKPISVS